MPAAGHLAGGIAGKGCALATSPHGRRLPVVRVLVLGLVSCGGQFGEGGGEEGGRARFAAVEASLLLK